MPEPTPKPMPRPLILLGVSGGIAAYKSPELLRALQTAGYDVRVLLTRAARRFVTPLTFAALTGHPTITSLWHPTATTPDAAIEHIALAQAADLLLIAPATANTLARLAHGLATDLLATVALATTAPLVLAPAMNVNMLAHPATQANLTTLRNRGATIIDPTAGYLACGMTGAGRLAEIPSIVVAVQQRLAPSLNDLNNETILITAGGTREPIDPVRFLGNRSSGKMGHALAEAAHRRGARVLLVTASPLPAAPGIHVIRVTTAAEMHAAVLAHLSQATVVIGAAAVADFRPTTIAAEKLRRSGPLTLTFEPTEDILADVTLRRSPGTLVLAFAAETHNVLESARAKLLRKRADAIIANDVSLPGLGFDADHNAATWISTDANSVPEYVVDLGQSTKLALADRILDELRALRSRRANIIASKSLTPTSA